MSQKPKSAIRGVRLQFLNSVMLASACVLFVLVLVSTFLISVYYRQLTTATDHYIQCQSAGSQLADASDYLTEQARLYVTTQDMTYLENYFTELNVTQRRENALTELSNEGDYSTDTLSYLQAALNYSIALSEDELYAMKLVATATGLAYPDLSDVSLTTADVSLTSKAMLSRAKTIVFGTDYLETKAQITDYTETFLADALYTIRQTQLQCRHSLRRMLTIQGCELMLLFIVCLLNFIMNLRTVLHPLRKYAQHIAEDTPLDVTGPYELQFLAQTYNNALSAKDANRQILQYKANHDPLTQILNRDAFDRAMEMLRDNPEPVAMLLIDIDTFKSVNDTFGHEVGDRILRRVATLLQETFRAKDLTIRLGGDEFAVILIGAKPEQQSMLENQVGYINYLLQHPTDDLPKVSLSVGVAFSPHGLPESLYRRADKALYYVKKQGRCGCSFCKGSA